MPRTTARTRTRRLLLGVLTTLVVLGFAIPAVASADLVCDGTDPLCVTGPLDDTTGPVVHEVTISPTTIDTSLSNKTVHVQVHATDDLSGLATANVYFNSPSNTQQSSTFASSLLSGTDQDGIYDLTLTFPRYAETGTWKLISLTLRDKAGNNASLNGTQLAAAGQPTQITQTGTADTTGPVVHEVTISPTTIDTSLSNKTVHVQVHATDDLSGLATANVYFNSPSNTQQSSTFASSLLSGTDQDGIYDLTLTFPRYAETGTWKLISLTLRDKAGNNASLNGTQLAAAGQPTGVSNVDHTPPAVSCGPAPSSDWHAGNVSVTCTATDGVSGLANAGDASFTLSTSVPDGDETATATTASRVVCDQAGNCTPVSPFTGIKVDRKAPTVTFTGIADDETVDQDAAITLHYACADGGSGLATCAGEPTDGSLLDTSTPGSHTASVETTDQVGNHRTATLRYTVRATAPVDLPTFAGETFVSFAPWTDLHEATAECHLTGPSTYAFDVSGTATGPYPGPYRTQGTVTLGTPALDGGGAFDTDLLFGPTVSVDATFTVHSGAVTITGAHHLTRLGLGKGVCASFTDHRFGGRTGSGDAIGLSEKFEWNADLTGPGGASRTDHGGGQITASQYDIHEGPGSGASNAGFVTTFQSINGLASPPTVTIDTPLDDATYTQGDVVHASYACADTGAGVGSCVGTVPNGAAIDTSTVGTHTFSVRGADDLDFSTTKTVHYRVTAPAHADYADIVLSDHPMSYWRLGDGADTGAMVDETGAHSGEYKNGAGGSLQEGISGDGNTVAVFAGNGTYGYVNGIAAPQHEYTMETWVAATDTGDGMIMQQGGAGALFISGGHYAFRQVDTTIRSSAVPQTDTHFDHVVGTWDGTTARLYVNGHLEASAPSTKAPSGSGTFYIGYGDLAPWFRGYLDEFAYYPSALSAARVQAHFDADPPPPLWIPRTLRAAPAPAPDPTPSPAPAETTVAPTPPASPADSLAATTTPTTHGTPLPSTHRTPAPTATAAPAPLSVARTTLRATSTGAVTVTVRNTSTKRVRGTVTITSGGRAIGTARVDLRAGRSAPTTVRLTKQGRTLLKRHRTVKVTVTVATVTGRAARATATLRGH